MKTALIITVLFISVALNAQESIQVTFERQEMTLKAGKGYSSEILNSAVNEEAQFVLSDLNHQLALPSGHALGIGIKDTRIAQLLFQSPKYVVSSEVIEEPMMRCYFVEQRSYPLYIFSSENDAKAGVGEIMPDPVSGERFQAGSLNMECKSLYSNTDGQGNCPETKRHKMLADVTCQAKGISGLSLPDELVASQGKVEGEANIDSSRDSTKTLNLGPAPKFPRKKGDKAIFEK